MWFIFKFFPLNQMILLMLHLIHIKCLEIQYFQSYVKNLDGSQFHFHLLAVWTNIHITLHKNIVLKESNVYNRTSMCLS